MCKKAFLESNVSYIFILRELITGILCGLTLKLKKKKKNTRLPTPKVLKKCYWKSNNAVFLSALQQE